MNPLSTGAQVIGLQCCPFALQLQPSLLKLARSCKCLYFSYRPLKKNKNNKILNHSWIGIVIIGLLCCPFALQLQPSSLKLVRFCKCSYFSYKPLNEIKNDKILNHSWIGVLIIGLLCCPSLCYCSLLC